MVLGPDFGALGWGPLKLGKFKLGQARLGIAGATSEQTADLARIIRQWKSSASLRLEIVFAFTPRSGSLFRLGSFKLGSARDARKPVGTHCALGRVVLGSFRLGSHYE